MNNMKELEDWIQEIPVTVQPECVTKPPTLKELKITICVQ